MLTERYLAFPFRIGSDGSVATVDLDVQIRQRVEQILFTSPGERVMLPEFGSGARDLVFGANGDVLAAAAEFTIARALQQHMGSTVLINAVTVTPEGERLQIEVVYTRARDVRQERATFRLEAGRRGAVSRG